LRHKVTNVTSAADFAAAQVAAVRDDPAARLTLMNALYESPPGRRQTHLSYRRAALAFMEWEVRRGLLRPAGSQQPGSPWWRAINERLLRDTAESRALAMGLGGPASSTSVARALQFVQRPSVQSW
jgi:hypothetical protein